MARRSCCRFLAAVMLIGIIAQVDSYGTGYTNCETDIQCGPTEFCYVSGLCVPCLDCASYRRHNLTEIQCAKDAKHCGSCFDGWKDDIFLNGDRRDSCIASSPLLFRQNPPEHYTADPVIRLAQLGELIIIAVTASVFVIGGFLWCRTNWTKPSRVLPTDNAPAPPQCRQLNSFWDLSENQMTHNSRSSSGSSNTQEGAIQTTIFTAEVHKDVPQQAIPFLRPRYEMDNSEEEEEELEEVHSPQSPDMSFLHDQDTMPSSWTPHGNESTSSVETSTIVTQEPTSSANDESSNDSQQSGPSQAKRIRVSHSESDSGIDVFNPQPESQAAEETAINFYITNNVVIRKS